ncbi:MAG TPA: AAA family ATPase, partial [bacterium]|nr:AAA family ATPase [bacterium]
MKNTIKKIIFDFHSGGAPQLIERNYNIPLSSKKIVSIIGPRRAGKTYILFQFIKKLSAKIDKKKILYLNFEDERLFFNNNYDIIFEAYFELYPEINKHDICLFLDEIQELPNWEKFIRRVYDSITKNIF